VKVSKGEKHFYLGVAIDMSTAGKVKLSMISYVREVMKLYDVKGKARTPATENLYKMRDSPLLEDKRREEFHSRVAKLLYVAKRVRPDILTAVGFLTTRVKQPNEDDWSKPQRCLAYLLNETKDLIMTLDSTDGINVHGYFDAA